MASCEYQGVRRATLNGLRNRIRDGRGVDECARFFCERNADGDLEIKPVSSIGALREYAAIYFAVDNWGYLVAIEPRLTLATNAEIRAACDDYEDANEGIFAALSCAAYNCDD